MGKGDAPASGSIDEPDGGTIRETYEEYDVGSSTVGMITDPENVHAWILSNATQPIRR
ncbi:hypothetical protein [Natronococcus pandeyae]|uniref:hypothetical protein n=1 Tax=Natronococcus pandeyae TaxID=2055836 RepID=UPI0016533A7B|nr:hypothetical protein [Natronococcus pandeyae]